MGALQIFFQTNQHKSLSAQRYTKNIKFILIPALILFLNQY